MSKPSLPAADVTDSRLLPHGSIEGTGPAALYRIDRAEAMRPFLASVVSDGDLWMYVSSTGGLTAGRRNEDGSIFPYVTDDLLHEAAGLSGPVTVLRVHAADGSTEVWRPFTPGAVSPDVTRSLAKSVAGDRIVFAETHACLGLCFTYDWRACDRFGWVRTCTLESTSGASSAVEVLDGLRNIIPANVQLATLRAASCLINAYSTAELDVASGLLTVALSSQIVDRPEPSESLFANVVWQSGLRARAVLLCADQLDRFARTGEATTEPVLRGRRACYFVVADTTVAPGKPVRWRIAADARRSQAQVVSILRQMQRDELDRQIDESLDASADRLHRIVAGADGSQDTGDQVVSAHHFSNTLFNSFRGGAVLEDGAPVPREDFLRFLAQRNRPVLERFSALVARWPASMPHRELVTRAESAAAGDPALGVDLLRLANEYLPLAFGRRHGDPSRPWNRFDIVTTHPDGSPALSYEGNWRDIFQNWEALAASHSDLLEPIIAKFVNASTPDGFNPYRITRAGIDWEVPEPDNPWSHIGYWGDHQIAYLLRLLEMSQARRPGVLASWLDRAAFSYADVPYRLRSHAAICTDPKHTIDFDLDAHRSSMSAVERIGTDGRLVRTTDDRVVHATFAEKLIVPALSKLSSLVPGAGIWMNTQRPEWNDANNALVGNGVSMVTLAYLRRYLAFVLTLIKDGKSFTFRPAVTRWMREVATILSSTDASHAARDDMARRTLLDQLGLTFERYRASIGDSFGQPGERVQVQEIREWIGASLAHLDEAIAVNRRPDGLYHAYNLMLLTGGSARIEHLDAMLEGQVAILSSGLLTPAESVALLESMFASPLYREDQNTFMLYPRRKPTAFIDKARLERVDVPLLQEMLSRGDTRIVLKDDAGDVRFNPEFRNDRDLKARLDALTTTDPALAPRITADREKIVEAYECVFHHSAFTGRSGSMFGYEGIGCVYWHMVAKLLLAVQECFDRTARTDPARNPLATLYYRVRSGLGFNKTPAEYGAFPLDAYSHTPLHAGAQQPGMTGQVKEEFLTRMGELGVRVIDGAVTFDPSLLRVKEFSDRPRQWSPRCDGRAVTLEPGTLGFTLAGVPVVYRLATSSARLTVIRSTGESSERDGLSLDPATTQSLLSRDGSIQRIEVELPRSALLQTTT